MQIHLSDAKNKQTSSVRLFKSVSSNEIMLG